MKSVFLKSIYTNAQNIKPIAFFINRINKGHERSVNAKKNILASLIFRGFSIAISLILVPLTIHYINPLQYGIWLTLSSIIGWFSFFDIGFGNGLRNKLGEVLATGQKEIARVYVSTTYAILTIIISIVIILFLSINPFLNWTKILNAPPEMAKVLSTLALLIFVFFSLRFVFQLINTVLNADQKPAKAFLFDTMGSAISLIIIFVLTKTTQGSLIYLGTVLSITPVIVLSISSFWLYRGKYKEIAPSIKFVKFSYAKDLMTLGLKYFIISIASLVVYQTTNIIITQICGPKDVTVYNIAFKYFGVLTMSFSMFLAPFWNAYTEAKALDDYTWMKSMLIKIKAAWFILLGLALVLLIFSSFIYKIWLGNKIIIPFNVSFMVFIYMLLFNWCAIFSQITAGLGKIKLQVYAAIICSIINIPLSIYLGKLWGVVGIVMAGTILSCTSAIWNPIQINLLLNKKAKGIWNE